MGESSWRAPVFARRVSAFFFQLASLFLTLIMARPYRKLTLHEEQYLRENYDDEPKAIAQIAAHLQVHPQQVLKYAKYRKLRASSRCSWGEEELQLLDGFAETMPLRMLVSTWNRLAQKEGRPRRSFYSIKKKLFERGHSRKADGSYLTVPAVANLLNRSPSWIQTLIKTKKLRAIKDSTYWVIKPKWLRKFVFSHPYEATERLDKEQFADLLLTIGDTFGGSQGDRF